MTDHPVLPGGALPPDDVVRLLRLLKRRGAHLLTWQSGERYVRVERSGDCLGIVPVETCQRAAKAGLIEVRQGTSILSAQGRVVVEMLRTGTVGNTGNGEPTISSHASAAASDHKVEPGAKISDRPGFDADESPLAWLARRRDKDGRPLISQIEYDAGERFRADFYFARMSPRVTANWSPDAGCGRGRFACGGGAGDMRDNVVAARERVRLALVAVGPELAGILIDVCGHLKGLEQTERGAGWPARSGKIILQLALSSLARHYGLKPMPASGRVRHWGAQGYRPTLDATDAPDAGAT